MNRIPKFQLLFLLILYLILTISGCGSDSSSKEVPETKVVPLSFALTSAVFEPDQPIPVKYTCDGDDISPPLRWDDPPPGVQSFALIADDPDAGGIWVHWVLYNLPGQTHSLAEAIPSEADLPGGGEHGKNSWGRLGYGGPCPPSGTHRYFFKLYALDTVLDLDAGANKKKLLEAMEGHILGEGVLMGTYTRQ